MERYINDNAVLAHLRPALDSGTSMFIAFRAGTIAASDDEVVALVAKYYYNVCREGNTSPSSQVVRLRALIELRPHLIDRLLDATPSTALREAIAHSRHVHDHRLLARLLETTLDQLNETLVSTAHASVTWALISNPVTDPGVRAALIAQDDTQSHNWSSYFAVAFPSQVSPNYDEVTDLTVIQTLTDHMLSRGQHHVSWGLVKWDLLLLARNPHLTPDQALDILNGLDDKPLRRHAGDYLVVPVRAVLCAQLKSVLTPDFVPHRVNLSMDTKPKQWYPSTSETVRSSFSKDTLGSKDAASLTEVLGDNPQAWIAFFGLLDSADSLTPTLKVAATARRLATA
jgi:hypothetical protein